MIKIITDSTNYLPPDLIARHDVSVVPITLSFGNDTYREGIDIDTETFFTKLAHTPLFPTTSQPPPRAFVNLWKPMLQAGHEIITVLLSSGVSGTIATARAALAHLGAEDKISIVDSASTAMGLGFQVVRAAELAAQGMARLDVVTALERMRNGLQILLVPDTLENLHRGGRINTVRAWLGTVLNIKPLLTFTRGILEPVEQIRTTQRAQSRMIELTSQFLGRDPYPWISVMHSRSPDRMEKLLAELKILFPSARFFTGEIGPGLGVHLGIGGTGIIACKSSVLA